MWFENLFPKKTEPKPRISIEVEPDFENFVPEEFKQDPITYFEKKGMQIKPGGVVVDKTGKIREDPTAVRTFVWQDAQGNQINVVIKKVNIRKGQVMKSRDPFYEYKVMKLVHELGLPTARPIASVIQVRNGETHYFIVIEKVGGFSWYEREIVASKLKEKGFSDQEIENLRREAQNMMENLKRRFEEIGIIRGWKLQDMIFDIDFETGRIRKIIPVDWEKTKIDKKKIEEYKRKRN